MVYIYIYLIFPILLLIVVTILFLRSLKSSEIPANAQLLVDAWNSVADNYGTADLSPDQTDDPDLNRSCKAVTEGLGQKERTVFPSDISKFSYQDRCCT